MSIIHNFFIFFLFFYDDIMTIELFGLENIPIVDSSSDISEIIKDAIDKQGCSIEHGDIILIAETLISKSEMNLMKLLKWVLIL